VDLPLLCQNKVLLHCCCAPCSCAIIERLSSEGVSFSLFFYNPNIHPQDEYERRKAEIIRYASKFSIPFIDAEHDTEQWFRATQDHVNDPEGGNRCSICFRLRLSKTAQYAATHGFSHIATTLGNSRHKNLQQVTAAGMYAASLKPELTFLDINWRKQGGSARADQISKEEGFYRQEYCGCMYSFRTQKTLRITTSQTSTR
jgi:predicted adenine nucleotide alpha hydrolase (AANH) superfamily ATPase